MTTGIAKEQELNFVEFKDNDIKDVYANLSRVYRSEKGKPISYELQSNSDINHINPMFAYYLSTDM